MIEVGPHRVSIGSINGSPVRQMLAGKSVDVMYVDPPWGDGHMKLFMTLARRQAGLSERPEPFDALLDGLMQLMGHVTGVVYIEMGLRWEGQVEALMQDHLANVTVKHYRYQRTRPFAILAGTRDGSRPPMPLTHLQGPALVSDALKRSGGFSVLDPCCGKGMTARAALENQMVFYGNELNAVRAAETGSLLRRMTNGSR